MTTKDTFTRAEVAALLWDLAEHVSLPGSRTAKDPISMFASRFEAGEADHPNDLDE